MPGIARKDVRQTGTVTVEDEEVLRKLEELKGEITAEEIEEDVHAGAEIIRKEMEDRVPGDEQTGTLAEGIVKETVEAEETKVAVAVAPSREAFYGKFFELGADPGPPKKPFMRPAFDAKKGRAQDKIARLLWKRIEDIAE